MKPVSHKRRMADALASIIEWTGDTTGQPPEDDFAAWVLWQERRLLMIRNAARAALAKAEVA